MTIKTILENGKGTEYLFAEICSNELKIPMKLNQPYFENASRYDDFKDRSPEQITMLSNAITETVNNYIFPHLENKKLKPVSLVFSRDQAGITGNRSDVTINSVNDKGEGITVPISLKHNNAERSSRRITPLTENSALTGMPISKEVHSIWKQYPKTRMKYSEWKEGSSFNKEYCQFEITEFERNYSTTANQEVINEYIRVMLYGSQDNLIKLDFIPRATDYKVKCEKNEDNPYIVSIDNIEYNGNDETFSKAALLTCKSKDGDTIKAKVRYKSPNTHTHTTSNRIVGIKTSVTLLKGKE